jgi:hypothetical protein
LRHFAYASGWKKFEPLWDVVIRTRQTGSMLPVLEGILSEFGRRKNVAGSDDPGPRIAPALPPPFARRGEPSGPPAAAPGIIPLQPVGGIAQVAERP